MKDDIFISYRRNQNKSFALFLKKALDEHFNAFLDLKDIDSGTEWSSFLEKKLKEVSTVLVLIGKDWELDRLAQTGDVVRMEVETALKSKKKNVVPVLVGEDTTLPPKDQLPGRLLKKLHDLNYKHIIDPIADTESLIKELNGKRLEKEYGEEARDFAKRYGDRYQFENILGNPQKKRDLILLAQDTKLNRKVVIRIFRGIKDDSLKERILRAVQLAKHIPNCVNIYDADFEKIDHVVLEYLEKGSLRHWMDNNTVGVYYARVIKFLRKIIDALILADEPHANLKPTNILMSNMDIPYINPLNKIFLPTRSEIRKSLKEVPEDDPASSEDFRYLAPETLDLVYKGLSDDNGWKKVDQFMLGLLGYELLGDRVHAFHSLKELEKQPNYEVLRQRIGRVKNCASDALTDILYRMTEPNPSNRFRDLEDVKERLEEIKIVRDDSVSIARESFLRCLKTKLQGKRFLPAFYETFIVGHEEINAKFQEYNIRQENELSVLKHQNHLQGAIFGLLHFAEEARGERVPFGNKILSHIRDRHGSGRGQSTQGGFYIGAKDEHYDHFHHSLIGLICGTGDSEPFDPKCEDRGTRIRIQEAWTKVLDYGISYMKDR